MMHKSCSNLQTDMDTWKATTNWTDKQLKELSLSFIEDDPLCSMEYDSFEYPLHYDARRILLSGLAICNYNHDLSSPGSLLGDDIPFFNRIHRLVTAGKDCKDTPLYDILSVTGFEGRILHFIRKPKLAMRYRDIHIESSADYAVYSVTPCFVHVIAIEDASCSRAMQSMEHQLAGDMLIAAISRIQTLPRLGTKFCSQNVYGIILRGDMVYLYQAHFDPDYLSTVGGKFISKSAFGENIYRQSYYSLLFPADRKSLVQTLTVYKHFAETDARDFLHFSNLCWE